MAMANRFAGSCADCRARVAPEKGVAVKEGGSWRVYCAACRPTESAPRAEAAPVIDVVLVDQNSVAFSARGFLGSAAFGAFRDAVGQSARYDAANKRSVTTVQAAGAVVEALRAAGLQVSATPDASARLAQFTAAATEAGAAAQSVVDGIEERSGWKFFPFQRAGVDFLARREAALIADDMGLGKTCQVLGAIPGGPPVVIVCPAVAKGVWRREIARVRPDLRMGAVYAGTKDAFAWPSPGEVAIVNYDILARVTKQLGPAPEGTIVVADEAHRVKSSKAQMTVAFKALCAAARKAGGRAWLVTATPLMNRPLELWTLLRHVGLEVEAFGAYGRFADLFGAKKERFGTTWYGPSSEGRAEVAKRLAKVMIRRMKRDVLTELPPKAYRDLQVEIEVTAEMRAALASICERLDITEDALLASMELASESAGFDIDFETMSAVRAALASAKIPALIEAIEEFEDAGEPIVVFSDHRAPILALKNREGWAVITGDTSAEERTAIEERFQAGKLKGVGATIKAGGVAITLTRASNAIFVDRCWTPALNRQAEDRVFRIGQTRGVVITTLVADHPVDEAIARVVSFKESMEANSIDAARLAPEAYAPGPAVAGTIGQIARSEAPASAPHRAATAESFEGERPPPAPSRTRPAETPLEIWAHNALMILSGLDADMARERNGVGFNGSDTRFGNGLARSLEARGGLSDAAWKAAAEMCRKYSRQVGSPPGAAKTAKPAKPKKAK